MPLPAASSTFGQSSEIGRRIYHTAYDDDDDDDDNQHHHITDCLATFPLSCSRLPTRGKGRVRPFWFNAQTNFFEHRQVDVGSSGDHAVSH